MTKWKNKNLLQNNAVILEINREDDFAFDFRKMIPVPISIALFYMNASPVAPVNMAKEIAWEKHAHENHFLESLVARRVRQL